MGTIQIDGSTPKITVGNATAEDATILFDGNAQDFYIALDDSADDLLIGLGSTVGTTPMLSFTEAKAAAFTGAVTMASTLGVTGVVTGAGFTAGSAVLAEAELELLDGLTAGTAIASKVVTTDASIDTTGQRNLTISGEIDAATGDFSGAVDVAGATTTAAITASGIVKTDDTTAATSTTDGSLQTDGGLSVALDAIIGDDLTLITDSAVLGFGADKDTTLTHTDGTGLTLNSTNKLCFNDTSQFIQGISATVLGLGATDEIDLTATTVDLNGTLNVSGVATFQATPVFPDGSLAIIDLDIDGGTDIGAALVDADEIIVDDGGGGANRRCDMSRVKTYIGSPALDIAGTTEESGTLATGDELLIYDASAAANRSINVANFLKCHANHTSSSVGTLVLAQADQAVTPGNTLAGSSLDYSHTSTALSGTWIAMGGTGTGDRCCWRRTV